MEQQNILLENLKNRNNIDNAPFVQKLKDCIAQLKNDGEIKESRIIDLFNKNKLLIKENEKTQQDLEQFQNTMQQLDEKRLSAILKIISENEEIKNLIASSAEISQSNSNSEECVKNNNTPNIAKISTKTKIQNNNTNITNSKIKKITQ